MSAKFTSCNRCGKVINYGESHVSINRNVEQGNINPETQEEHITVSHSSDLMILCLSCSNSFNEDNIAKIIKAIPIGPNKITDN